MPRHTALLEGSGISLQVEISVGSERLDLDYRIQASSDDQRLLVCDALWRVGSDSRDKYDEHLAFVSYVPPATLRIKRTMPALPVERNVFRAYIPWIRTTDMRHPLSGEVRLPIPIREYSPYYNDNNPPREEVVATRVEFSLGYFFSSREPELIDLQRGLYFVDLLGQPIIEATVSIELDSPLQVFRRIDQFERV